MDVRNRSHRPIRSMAQYSTKMIFAVLDVSLIMGLNIGETDKVFYINLKLMALKCHKSVNKSSPHVRIALPHLSRS